MIWCITNFFRWAEKCFWWKFLAFSLSLSIYILHLRLIHFWEEKATTIQLEVFRCFPGIRFSFSIHTKIKTKKNNINAVQFLGNKWKKSFQKISLRFILFHLSISTIVTHLGFCFVKTWSNCSNQLLQQRKIFSFDFCSSHKVTCSLTGDENRYHKQIKMRFWNL